MISDGIIKIAFRFPKFKESIIFVLSILHEQTTAKAHRKLVG